MLRPFTRRTHACVSKSIASTVIVKVVRILLLDVLPVALSVCTFLNNMETLARCQIVRNMPQTQNNIQPAVQHSYVKRWEKTSATSSIKKLRKSKTNVGIKQHMYSQHFEICVIFKFAEVWRLWCSLTLQHYQFCVGKIRDVLQNSWSSDICGVSMFVAIE